MLVVQQLTASDSVSTTNVHAAFRELGNDCGPEEPGMNYGDEINHLALGMRNVAKSEDRRISRETGFHDYLVKPARSAPLPLDY